MARKKPKINLGSDIPARSGDLEKLFSSEEDVEQASGLELISVRLDAIQPDPNQPRRTFSEENLAELAESIRQDGVIQPIEVTEIRPNQYMIVHGERRWRAAEQAGLEVIPAVVQRRNYDEITRFVRQLVENIQREDLNDVDRAYGMVRLRDMMQAELDAKLAEGEGSGKPHSRTISWAKVSRRLGFSRQRASQLIQLLDLPEEIKDAVRAGEISERETRVLQGLRPSQQRALYRARIAGDVSANEYKQVARFLKNEMPEMTVYEAIDVLHKPLPPVTTPQDAEEEEWEEEETAVFPQVPSSPSPDTAEPESTRVTNVKRLDYVRGHLSRVERHNLTPDERRELVRLLHLIEQDVASLLAALEESER